MKPICFRLQAFSPSRQLLQFFVFVLTMFVGTGFAQQNLPNPLPDLSFQLAFRADGDGKLTAKQYTLAGPAGGGLLYGGLRFVQAGESLYFATERQDVYRFDVQTGVSGSPSPKQTPPTEFAFRSSPPPAKPESSSPPPTSFTGPKPTLSSSPTASSK